MAASVRTHPPPPAVILSDRKLSSGGGGCYKSPNDIKAFQESELRARESQGCQLWLAAFFAGEKGIMMGDDKITRG